MNLIQNPTFDDDGAHWHVVGAVMDAGDGAAVIRADEPSSNIQLYQTGLSLKAATRYRLSFTASGTDDLAVFVHRHRAPYESYGLMGYEVGLSEEPRRVTVFFTTPDAGDLDGGRLRFWFAPFARPGSRWRIDDVELSEAAEEPQPEPSPVDLSRQISVIVRDIPPGGRHEVRHVRPDDLVIVDGDIDWASTRFTAYILMGDEEAED